MYTLQKHLNFSLHLFRNLEFFLFFFYTNDKTVESKKEKVANKISSFFHSILMTNIDG